MKFVKHITILSESIIVDCLSDETALSKSVIKDCLNKGCVWLKKRKSKERRVRKAKYTVHPGELVSLYYDEEILQRSSPIPEQITSDPRYSVWYKPAGMLSQGTRYGDHCSLLRVVEKQCGSTFLIHRLDREAEGLVLLAHSSSAAGKLSHLFAHGHVEKRYRATVDGILGSPGQVLSIKAPLDGKRAHTDITVTSIDRANNRTAVDILLHTGRYHQIRRHLSSKGFPLVGDYRYGRGRGKALQLRAYSLAFTCPFTGEKLRFQQ